MTYYNRTESLLIRLNDGRVEGNKEENQDHGKPFGHSNITPTCLQAGEGAAPGKGGPWSGWLLVGTQASGQKQPSTQLRLPKEGKSLFLLAAQSHGPLPSLRGSQAAQDTRDPGPAVPWRQEQLAHVRTRLEGDPETPGVPPSLPPKSKRRGVTHLR